MPERARHVGFFDTVRMTSLALGRHVSEQEAAELIGRLPLEAALVPRERRAFWLLEEARARIGLAALDVANLKRGRRLAARLRLICAQVYLRALLRLLQVTAKLRVDP